MKDIKDGTHLINALGRNGNSLTALIGRKKRKMSYKITITLKKEVTEDMVNTRCERHGVLPIEYHRGLNRHRIVCGHPVIAFAFAQSFKDDFIGKLIIEKQV